MRLWWSVCNHVTVRLFQLIQSLGAPHVESFNYVIREGLDKAVKDILAVEFYLQNEDRICMKFEVRQIWDTCVVVFSKLLNMYSWYLVAILCSLKRRAQVAANPMCVKLLGSFKVDNLWMTVASLLIRNWGIVCTI